MAIAHFVHENGYQPPVPRWAALVPAAAGTVASGAEITAVAAAALATAANPKLKELLIHRIPATLLEKDIFSMLTTHTNIIPSHIDPITRQSGGSSSGADNGKTCIRFSTVTHCNLAFDSISGPNRPDKSGHPQKRVYLKSGGYINVRKFV
jgi:hypothetical protein